MTNFPNQTVFQKSLCSGWSHSRAGRAFPLQEAATGLNSSIPYCLSNLFGVTSEHRIRSKP